MKVEKLWFTAAITSRLLRSDVKVRIKTVTKTSKLQQAGTDGFMIIAATVTDAINMIRSIREFDSDVRECKG
ncbi:hypothetical protein Tco_0899780 [Tanacetum coccineum]